MAAESQQATLSGSINHIGVDFVTPKTTGQNIVLKDAPAGNVVMSFSVQAGQLGIMVDKIFEQTAAAGVTIDSVLLKDNQVTALNIIATTNVQTDTIAERTAAAGVTVDGLLIKDGGIAASGLTSGSIPDARVPASNVTQHVAAIDHNSLLNYSVTQHRIINDAGTSATQLWSASKINTEIALKANAGVNADITSMTAVATIERVGAMVIGTETSGALSFKTLGVNKIVLATDTLRPASDNVTDLGSTSINYRDIFFKGQIKFGGTAKNFDWDAFSSTTRTSINPSVATAAQCAECINTLGKYLAELGLTTNP